MKKLFIIPLLLLLVTFSGCDKKDALKRPTGTDFLSLMGKDHPRWKYAKTKEDLANLAFFGDLYDKNIVYLNEPGEEYRIPKILHYIWLGPKNFPLESVQYVRTWLGNHPDWTVYFWTDMERPLPHPSMKRRLVSEIKWEYEELHRLFDNSTDWAERSDILRLELVSQMGGMYVDHDVQCMKSFDPLHQAFDLFCGMELPQPTSLESSLFPTNNILAARAHHPVIAACKKWLIANWDEIEKTYPGQDKESLINRITHRTFYVLGKIMKEQANQGGNRDVALPTMYFNAPKDDWAIFARHMYAGTWFDNESKFEKTTRQRLMYLSKKTNKILLFCAILLGVNILGFGGMSYLIIKRKRG